MTYFNYRGTFLTKRWNDSSVQIGMLRTTVDNPSLSLSLSLPPSFVYYCSNNILCSSTIYSNHILSLVGKFLPERPTVSWDKFWKGRSKQIFHSINLWKIYHGKPTNRYWHQWRLLHVHGVRALSLNKPVHWFEPHPPSDSHCSYSRSLVD